MFDWMSPATRAKFDEYRAAEVAAGNKDAAINAALDELVAAAEKTVATVFRVASSAGDLAAKQAAAEFGQLAVIDLAKLLSPAA